MKKSFMLLLATVVISYITQAQIITTFAGTGTPGYSGDNASATAAELNIPAAVAVDGSGNVYIADAANNRIRKVNTAGVITTIAGTGTQGYSGDNGTATDAKLNQPTGVAFDGSGNLYFMDGGNDVIRKINASGIITTIAGNGTFGYSGDNAAATDAELNQPSEAAIDGNGNIYIADFGNNSIRKINTSGIITTVAGNGTAGYSGDNGPATDAELSGASGVALDGNGNVYVADYTNNRIREINSSTGIITTVAGNGTPGYSGDNAAAVNAELALPYSLSFDGSGNMYIADSHNNCIRKINTSGIITTIAGNGTVGYSGDNGPANIAELNQPICVFADNNSSNIYIAYLGNNRIRKVTATNTGITGISNNNSLKATLFPNPAIDNSEIIYTGADENINVSMTDVTGRTVYTTNATGQSGSIVLPLQSLAPGYYVVVTQSGEQKIVNKLVKE